MIAFLSDSLLQSLEALKAKWKGLQPLAPHISQAVQDQLRLHWIYNSNAIEGNTLTLGETAFFLREGLTSEGKPLKDYLEAKNHLEALERLEDFIHNQERLSESFIKQLHAVLFQGIDFTYAKTATGQLVPKPIHKGQYKQQPNHVLTLSGTIHQYVEPLKVPEEMEHLLISLQTETFHSDVDKAVWLHYHLVRIHPFDDGNGRLARILMNLILMQAGFVPAVIRNQKRREYLEALVHADAGEIAVFGDFIGQELEASFKLVLETVNGRKETTDP